MEQREMVFEVQVNLVWQAVHACNPRTSDSRTRKKGCFFFSTQDRFLCVTMAVLELAL